MKYGNFCADIKGLIFSNILFLPTPVRSASLDNKRGFNELTKSGSVFSK